jgi:hypothetical protein
MRSNTKGYGGKSDKIAKQLHLAVESCTIFTSGYGRPVRKLLDTPSGVSVSVCVYCCWCLQSQFYTAVYHILIPNYKICKLKKHKHTGCGILFTTFLMKWRFRLGYIIWSYHMVCCSTYVKHTLCRVLSLGVKRPGRESDHSSPSSAEVKECVELYLHSPVRLHGVVLS